MILAGDSKNDIEENYGVVEDDAQNFDFSDGDNYSEEDGDNDFEDGCDDLEDEIVWENKDPDNLNSADDVIMINGRVIYYR